MSNEEVNELTIEQKKYLIDQGNIFCLTTFLTGILKRTILMIFCKATLAIALFIIFKDTFKCTEDRIIFAILLAVFIFYEAIEHVIKYKTSINVNANAGFNLNK